MVDFKKRLISKNNIKPSNPIELYKTLDRKSIVGPLRPSQEYTLTEWYNNRRLEKDLIIKLHTGEGKTLIGLLMLQSTLNMEEGPCIYVCPSKYLAYQVCEEAKKFGIPYCVVDKDNTIPNEFYLGEKILITYAHKIFNGRSIFGVENNSIQVGTIILDDSHTCIDIIKDSFTISVKKDQNEILYHNILTLFSDDLREQRLGSFLDIESGSSETYMLVPYWAWINKREELASLLLKDTKSDEVKFVWPLMKDRLLEYSCFISGSKVEIAPYSITVEAFGVFSKAQKRILMSATTQEDIFFIKGLGFSSDSVINPIIYPKLKWSGEKMILIPSSIDERCDRELVATEFVKTKKSSEFGIVAIVPNTKQAMYYESLGGIFPKTNDELRNAINDLRSGKYSKLIVINNRYDGIDLPDESCRILILDSLPFYNKYSERYAQECCPKSEILNKKIAQKIEQGLGRAIRGEKDYCVILIIGNDIEKFMRSVTTRQYFSAQTQKQINIGFDVAKMAKEDIKEDDISMQQVYLLIQQILNRDEGWKDYYNSEMNDLTINKITNTLYDRYTKESKLEDLFKQGEYEEAAKHTQKFIDEFIEDEDEKGWYLEQMARYVYMYSESESEDLQKIAFKKNNSLLKPRRGVTYAKIKNLNEDRTQRIKKYLKNFDDYSELSLEVNFILNSLTFGVSAEKFESSLMSLGELLGFVSQRPDKAIRKGPDNLWGITDKKYIFFECKSEVDVKRKEISKTEVGQFNNHCGWFKSEYGEFVNVLRIMVIPTNKLAYSANFTDDVYVLKESGLRKLKDNVKKFVNELIKYDLNTLSDEKLQSFLDHCHLNYDDFENIYTEKTKK
ncbi:DEAD/DEAH box helicase [Veillonella parvula]|jgi:superfamily II helicase|uniref:DEAD/DEAH box helicase n=1 Tax=Veillonella parvula TaxID=29466 RepID=UPI00098A8C5B|nr:DEAD/DEAH box helicase [Veillonella parvula]